MIRNIIVIYDNEKQMQLEVVEMCYNHIGDTEWSRKYKILTLKSEDNITLSKYYFVSRYSNGDELRGLRFDKIIELPSVYKDNHNKTLNMEMVYERLIV